MLMASSDSFAIYIRSSMGLNFTVLASSDDDISSLKKKAEAQHLVLSPQNGRIFVQAIHIIHERLRYFLPDNIPLRCLLDGAKGILTLFIYVRASPFSAKTRTHVLDRCQKASSDSFVIYIRSSHDLKFNYAVLASSDDDISSLKKKAAAQHLAVFPHVGIIVLKAIKIMHEVLGYVLPDNIPVRCLFDGAKGIRLLFMDAVVVPPDSAETHTHILDLCQNALIDSSDSFVIYIRSSGLAFAVLASPDDNISSIKKKAAAQHLALFPRIGSIVSKAIKIMHEGLAYVLPDNIPVRCLFDGAKGICLLFMDAVAVPRDSAETHTHVLDLCQNALIASSDSFVIYIRSSDFTFAVLASPDDNISSIKKKAEAQHQALSPRIGRIVSQAIKIMHEGLAYVLPDNIPVRCLFDGAKGIRLLFMDEVAVPRDSAETRTHVLDLCQNEKAAAQHLALFPHNGRIVSQAIKIMNERVAHILPDNIPVRCLFDGAKGIRLLFMDAVTVPLDSAETHTHKLDLCQNGTHGAKDFSLDTAVVGVLSREGEENLMGGGIHISNMRQSQGDPSRSRDRSLNQGGNTSCTSETLKRKSPGGSTNKDPVVEEMTPAVGVLGEFAKGSTKQNKSKDPSSDEVSPETGDRMQERSAASENKTAAPGLTVMEPDELRCRTTDGKGWRCSKKAMPNSNYCTRHRRKSTSSKKK